MADSSEHAERARELIKVGILTVSDSCYSGQAEDRSGKNLKQLIDAKDQNKIIHGEVVASDIVPDELDKIKVKLEEWSDNLKLDVVLTTGGTGFSPRDLTPEATKEVIEREALGITIAMVVGSLQITSLAMLSRLTCGIRKRTLIINLPGSKKGSEECFRLALPGIPHAVDLLKGHSDHVKSTHQLLQSEDVQLNGGQEIVTQSTDSSDHTDKQEFHDSITQKEAGSFSLPIKPVPVYRTQDETGSNIVVKHSTNQNQSEHAVFNSKTSDVCKFYLMTDPSSQNQHYIVVNNIVCNRDQEQINVASELDSCDDNTADVEPTDVSDPQAEFEHLSRKPVLQRNQTSLLPLNSVITAQSSNVTEKRKAQKSTDIYDFEEALNQDDSSLNTDGKISNLSGYILKANIHKSSFEGEVIFVPVGTELKQFLKSHPKIRGIYLNKGKRDIKRALVTVKRQDGAVDTGSWKRGKQVHERNRFDDWFELTEEGRKKKLEVEKNVSRDVYVVNWYVWCPGYGNCLRRCGSYGQCKPDCPGKNHRQDRHNCSFMVNLKLYLSNLKEWRVHLTGSHVPPESGRVWKPPPPYIQRLSEDKRDAIILHSKEMTSSTKIMEVLTSEPDDEMEKAAISKRKISRFLSSMKKRRKYHSYDYKKTASVSEKMSGESASVSGELSKDQEKVEESRNDNSKTENSVSQTFNQSTDSASFGTEQNILDVKSRSLDKNLTVIKCFKIVDASGKVTYFKTGDKVT